MDDLKRDFDLLKSNPEDKLLKQLRRRVADALERVGKGLAKVRGMSGLAPL
jgi:hypothetical protein